MPAPSDGEAEARKEKNSNDNQSKSFTVTDHSKTNKTFDNVQAEPKVRQEIDDFGEFNNSEEDEKIDILDDEEEFENTPGILSDRRLGQMTNIDEEEEYKEHFNEAFAKQQHEGKQLQDSFQEKANANKESLTKLQEGSTGPLSPKINLKNSLRSNAWLFVDQDEAEKTLHSLKQPDGYQMADIGDIDINEEQITLNNEN